MTINELTVRDQLIVRILHMPDAEVARLAEFAEDLEGGDIDLAMIEARKKEPGIPLDEYLSKNGITREELEAIARAEGLIA